MTARDSKKEERNHDQRQQSRHRRKDAGFSLTELMVVVNIIGLMASIMTPVMLDQIEKARLARCLADMHGIQNAIFLRTTPGTIFPTPSEFWDTTFPGHTRGLYYYILNNSDPNAGHGNDMDGYDEENPGASEPDAAPLDFVILCQHDHKDLANYVYAVDDHKPLLAQPGDDPGYDDYIKWEFGGPGNEK